MKFISQLFDARRILALIWLMPIILMLATMVVCGIYLLVSWCVWICQASIDLPNDIPGVAVGVMCGVAIYLDLDRRVFA